LVDKKALACFLALLLLVAFLFKGTPIGAGTGSSNRASATSNGTQSSVGPLSISSPATASGNVTLAGVVGIENSVTIGSFSVSSSNLCTDLTTECFSVQQNFYVITPRSSSSAILFAYMVQNVILVEYDWYGKLHAAAGFWVWSYPAGKKIFCSGFGCGGVTENTVSLGVQWTLTSIIDNSGRLTASNALAPSSFSYAFPTGSVLAQPELIIVGFGTYPLRGTAVATFSSFTGSVDAHYMLSGMLNWQAPHNLVEPKSELSLETSHNLGFKLGSCPCAAISYSPTSSPANPIPISSSLTTGEGILFYPGAPIAKVGQLPKYQTSIALGKSVTITVNAENIGDSAYWMTLQIAFPHLTTPSNVRSESSDIPCAQGAQSNCVFPKGSTVQSNYGAGSTTLPYVMVEVSEPVWTGNYGTHYLTVTVTPPSAGPFDFTVKSIAASYYLPDLGRIASSDPLPSSFSIRPINCFTPQNSEDVIRDAQSECSYDYKVDVSASLTAEGLGSWISTTSYPIANIGFQSCPTYSGYMYCVGGPDKDAVYYAPLGSGGVGTWINTTAYPTNIDLESCAIYSGYIYCVGGQIVTGYFTDAFTDAVYYASVGGSGVGKWLSTTAYPNNIDLESCAIDSGQIYCVGGQLSTGAFTNAVYYASVGSDGVGRWTNTTAYPTSIENQSCAIDSGNIYCIGGGATAVYHASVVGSGGIGAWTETTPYPTTLYGLSCATDSGYIYCVGGFTEPTGDFTDAVYYAAISGGRLGAWMSTNTYPTNIFVQSCAASAGYIYCVGGNDGSGLTNAVYYAAVQPPATYIHH